MALQGYGQTDAPDVPAAAPDAESVYERLANLAPVCGSCLEPLLNGFVTDQSFRTELQEFISSRAPNFLVVCEDGSHPLSWTSYHDEYKELFERQLHKTVTNLDITGQELTDLCAWLRAENGHGWIFDDGVNAFLEAITACEEYDRFLAVMFAEVGRQAGEEIDVTVPDGFHPGQLVSVHYLGRSYEFAVPEHCGPGDVFREAVVRPAGLDLGSFFNVPDSFYGLD
eukprot:TRINITY_DN81996_c0_g1_i1.p1 TRINITY_DN81996_c0_g1~~TRINITY_DN81996_c0_g1_i1.p1  ORF type:complete len:226 (-),score=40.33 TRINITY_DN81996_c0_g1_i1:39-716(-)